MSEADIHRVLTMFVFVLAGVTIVATGRITAPYGRHAREGFGPGIAERWGWVIMESPAVLLFLWVFAQGQAAGRPLPLIFAALWLSHYVYRACVFPLRMRSRPGRRMPLLVIATAVGFNVINAYINARWISELGHYGWRWLISFRFLYGVMLFVTGMAINRWADEVLRRLRARGEGGYSIPRGGLYEDVSCPNYLGEIVQWFGWAIATWSLPGLAFACFSAANLLPRAVSHHRWYQRTFPDYPKRRAAIIPYVL